MHALSNWKLSPNRSDITSMFWQYIATQKIKCNHNMYVLIVDHITMLLVIFKIHITNNEVIITYMKSIFYLLGTPTIIYTDNDLSFQHRCSSIHSHIGYHPHSYSPNYPVSNELIERYVQTITNIIKNKEATI